MILGFAATQDSVVKGIALLAVYSLGLAVPFLLTSLGIGQFLKFYSRFSRPHARSRSSQRRPAHRPGSLASARSLYGYFELFVISESLCVVERSYS